MCVCVCACVRVCASQDVVLSFAPHQLGSFRVRQKVDVLGHVTDPWADDAAELRLRPFHTLTLDLSGICHAQTTYPEPMLNPGQHAHYVIHVKQI